MTWRTTAILGAAMASGCADGGTDLRDDKRFDADPEGFSCTPPVEWQTTRDRGAVLFTSAADHRRTIAVRAISLKPGESASEVFSDTQIVLRGLPQVALEPGRPVRASLSGTEYRLTFAPPTSNERFKRRHVVLRGKHHVFHVIETAPLSSQTDDAVLGLVSSMREEG